MPANFAGCSIYDDSEEEELEEDSVEEELEEDLEFELEEDSEEEELEPFEQKWNRFMHLLKVSPKDFPFLKLEERLHPLGPARSPPTEVGWICNSDPTILVLAATIISSSIDDDQLLFEFYKVDLKQCKLDEKFCPSISSRSGWLGMFGGSSNIYVFGDQSCHLREEKYGNPPNWYRGASVLDTSTKTWKSIPRPANHFTFWSCASLDNGNTLYHFGGWPFISPEVYNPASNSWEKLTPLFEESDDCEVSGAVISDPINKRFLFNINRGGRLEWGQLYAYYPDCKKKNQLVSVRVPWSNIAVVAKDVAYVCLHSRVTGRSCDMLEAYDLSTWISKPLEVVWASTLVEGSEIMDVLYSSSFGALFYEGSDIFWMSFTRQKWFPPLKTKLYFLKFTATREEDKITCEPLSLQQHDLSSSIHNIQDFVMIH